MYHNGPYDPGRPVRDIYAIRTGRVGLAAAVFILIGLWCLVAGGGYARLFGLLPGAIGVAIAIRLRHRHTTRARRPL